MENSTIPPFHPEIDQHLLPGIGTSMGKRMQEVLEQWQKEIGEYVVEQSTLKGRLLAYDNLLAMEAPACARAKMLTTMRAKTLEKLAQYQ